MRARRRDWMAHRMARLTRAHMDAAVSAGRYSDPADAVYLVETLESRRAAIIRRYLDDELEEGAGPMSRREAQVVR